VRHDDVEQRHRHAAVGRTAPRKLVSLVAQAAPRISATPGSEPNQLEASIATNGDCGPGTFIPSARPSRGPRPRHAQGRPRPSRGQRRRERGAPSCGDEAETRRRSIGRHLPGDCACRPATRTGISVAPLRSSSSPNAAGADAWPARFSAPIRVDRSP
jgi:hypothetical protein